MRYLIIGKILGLLLAVFSIIATAPAIVVAIKKRPAKSRWILDHGTVLDRTGIGRFLALGLG